MMFTDWLTIALVCATVGVAAMTVVGITLKKLGRVAAMDVFWGPLVLIFAITSALVGTILGSAGVLSWILVGMVALWAFRLARHIGTRFGSDVEDPRYEEMLAKPAAGLVKSVLLPQGGVAWLISLPMQVAAVAGDPAWPVVAAGALVALAGLMVEAVADRQLEAFRRANESRGIMDQGIWSWSRHPNYFGEAVI